MIPRYSRPQMAKIWERENYFRIQLEIETLACEAQAKIGVIPESAAKAVRDLGLPQTPADTALADAVAWFQAHGYTRAGGSAGAISRPPQMKRLKK